MSATTFIKDRTAKTLTMQRVFNAPRTKVFAAFGNVESLNTWWGPRGWDTTSKEFNFSAGGAWHYCMTCVDKAQGDWFGQEAWGKAVYDSINEPETITYRDYFCDSEGVINEQMPGTHVSMTFTELADGKTEVISISTFDTEQGFDDVIAMGVESGAGETWDRLEEYVKE